ADARGELYASLLGKSQTVFDRLRVGDLMARATDDTSQLSDMVFPGASLILESSLSIIVPLIYIAVVSWQMLLVPVGFILVYIFVVRPYVARLGPGMYEQRHLYGKPTAGLGETLSGMGVVRASPKEPLEGPNSAGQAPRLRDAFVAQGYIEARYLPLLFYA